MVGVKVKGVGVNADVTVRVILGETVTVGVPGFMVNRLPHRVTNPRQ
jgi:hypothetical protein